MNNTLQIKRLTETAIVPTKNLPTDLGYDLYADQDVLLPDNSVVLVPTGIAVKFPAGWGGFIKDRSSVATKQNIQTVAGVIDENYTGEIKVAIQFNQTHALSTRLIKAGDKIAQLVPIPVTNFSIVEVKDLPETDRGDKGFGSSGR